MFVIRNKKTKDFVTKRRYIVTNDISRARTFSKTNHCTCWLSVNEYNKNDYEILEVEIKLK